MTMFRDINMLNTDDDAMPLTIAECDSLLYGFGAVVDRAWWEFEHAAQTPGEELLDFLAEMENRGSHEPTE